MAGLHALVFTLSLAGVIAQTPPPSRDVPLTSPDGTRLQATYDPAATPGPAVVLLHPGGPPPGGLSPAGGPPPSNG